MFKTLISLMLLTFSNQAFAVTTINCKSVAGSGPKNLNIQITTNAFENGQYYVQSIASVSGLPQKRLNIKTNNAFYMREHGGFIVIPVKANDPMGEALYVLFNDYADFSSATLQYKDADEESTDLAELSCR